jgi:lambda family phage portal protein
MTALKLPAPTILDRAVGYLNPAAGLRRLQARAGLMFLGGFGAGGYTAGRKAGRALKEWNPGTSSADGDSIMDLPDLRGRSRDAVRNMPLATGAANTTALCVIGGGLVPHAEVDAEFLGISDEEAETWQSAAERYWWAWAGSIACDVERRRTFAELLEVVVRSEFESGDVFGLWRAVRRKNDVFFVKIQLIEADRVCNPDDMPDTDTIRGGIEFDPVTGEPVAYHVRDRHPGDSYAYAVPTWSRVDAFGKSSGDPMVLHVMHHIRPGQTRGIPDLAPVIEVLKQMSRWTDNELMAAVISSMFTVFIKAANGELPGSFAEIPQDGSNAGTAPNHAESEVKLGNGAVTSLAPGEDVTFAQPGRPNTAFDAFITSMAQQVGAAIGIPAEILLLKFTASYSAARGALLQAWRTFIARRGRIVNQFAQPCYERVISEAVARGYLAAPGFNEDPMIRRAWLNATWTGPTMGSLNPVDDANAAEKRINLTLTSHSQEKAALDGGDWVASARRLGRETKLKKSLDLQREQVGERIITEPEIPKRADDDPSKLPAGSDKAEEPDEAHLIGAGA